MNSRPSTVRPSTIWRGVDGGHPGPVLGHAGGVVEPVAVAHARMGGHRQARLGARSSARQLRSLPRSPNSHTLPSRSWAYDATRVRSVRPRASVTTVSTWVVVTPATTTGSGRTRTCGPDRGRTGVGADVVGPLRPRRQRQPRVVDDGHEVVGRSGDGGGDLQPSTPVGGAEPGTAARSRPAGGLTPSSGGGESGGREHAPSMPHPAPLTHWRGRSAPLLASEPRIRLSEESP